MTDTVSLPHFAAMRAIPMSGAELEKCLDEIRWSKRVLAVEAQVDEATVRRWCRDLHPVPIEVSRWVRKLAETHRRNPPPPPVPRYAAGAALKHQAA